LHKRTLNLYFQILVAIQRATLKLQNLAVLMALVLCSSNAAASFQTNELLQARIRLFEAWVANVMDEQALKGLSVSLVQDQQVVYTQGFGFADVENQNRTTADTTYRIGSVTKLFTSIALMQLVEAEKLSLDTPVIELVPELEAIQANGYALDEITIRSILTHTTGLPTNPNFILDKQAVFEPLVRHAFLQKLPGQRLLFQPNRTHKYSNLGMNLGGLIV
jgi:CubicO group peptidase (beta-lactamase class C family)